MTANDRFNVLIADDEPRFCEILEDLLGHEDINLYSVHTPENAINAVLNYDIHLTLLDKRFPTDIEGIQTLRRVKEINPETEVIMMTAYPDVESNLDAVELGAHSYLPKTMDYEKMHSVLKQLFEQIRKKKQNTSLLSELEQRNKWLESISGTIKNWNEKLVRRIKTAEKSGLIQQEEGEKALPPDNVELFAFALVHELNNHLQIIDLILSEFTHENETTHKAPLEELQKAIGQLSNIGESYSQIISGQESKEMQPTDLGLVLRYVFHAARRFAQPKRVSVSRRISLKKNKVMCQTRLISDALLNIIKNAVEAATPFGSETTPQVTMHAEENDSEIIIKIANTGAPVDENIFKNLFIGMSQKDGHMGVGLCLANYAIEKHNGKLDIFRKDDWNVFQISFPISELRRQVF